MFNFGAKGASYAWVDTVCFHGDVAFVAAHVIAIGDNATRVCMNGTIDEASHVYRFFDYRTE